MAGLAPGARRARTGPAGGRRHSGLGAARLPAARHCPDLRLCRGHSRCRRCAGALRRGMAPEPTCDPGRRRDAGGPRHRGGRERASACWPWHRPAEARGAIGAASLRGMDDRLGVDGRLGVGLALGPLLAGRPSYQSGAIGLDLPPSAWGPGCCSSSGCRSDRSSPRLSGSWRCRRFHSPFSRSWRVGRPHAHRGCRSRSRADKSNDRLRPGRRRAPHGERPRGVRDDPGHPYPARTQILSAPGFALALAATIAAAARLVGPRWRPVVAAAWVPGSWP